MTLPFDGAITKFFRNDAPKEVRRAIETADKDDILSKAYPYREEMTRKEYEAEIHHLNRLFGQEPIIQLYNSEVLSNKIYMVRIDRSTIYGMCMCAMRVAGDGAW